VNIRNFQPGDEEIQVALYNEAAADLPAFKPATSHEVQRRTRAKDFDPTTRLFATAGNKVIGYCNFHTNGRISYPWCCKGHEGDGPALFQATLQAMKKRGLPRAFAAYREDWQPVRAFFEGQNFARVRDMVNYIQDVLEMPTVLLRPGSPIVPLKREDVPAVFQLAPQALQVDSPEKLEEHLFRNPYFGPECLFVLRHRSTNTLVGVGLLITEATYAEPEVLDPLMPCYRLGAFGTEFMQTKRIKGLFSILVKDDPNMHGFALDLLGQAFTRIQDHDDIGTLTAQVPSDVPHLVSFYKRHFRRQGSFPVFERSLQ
jgi:hypothetical protein